MMIACETGRLDGAAMLTMTVAAGLIMRSTVAIVAYAHGRSTAANVHGNTPGRTLVTCKCCEQLPQRGPLSLT
jgi:hypothetical protein